MSGNFVRERQRIVYIYNIHVYVYYTCKQYVAAHARNFQTFLGRLWVFSTIWSTVHRFLVLLFENNDVIEAPNKILPRAPRVLSAALYIV